MTHYRYLSDHMRRSCWWVMIIAFGIAGVLLNIAVLVGLAYLVRWALGVAS